MTNQSPADLEVRVRTAMTRLANSHRPEPELHWPSNHESGIPSLGGATSRNRWLLVAASVAIVAAGIVAVAVVQDQDMSPSIDTTPLTVSPSTTDAVSTTTVPDAIEQLRFSEPLEPGAIATLEPPPASPAAAYDTGGNEDDFAFTRGEYATVWVLADNEWVGSLAVTDQPVPWKVATDGLSTTLINGTEAVVDEAQSTVALRLETGGTRVIRGGSDGPGQPELLPSAMELATVVGTSPIESALPTDRFVSPVAITGQSPLVRYGGIDDVDNTFEVLVSHLERSPSDDELRWMAAAMSHGNRPNRIDAATFTATLNSGQQSLVEQVSSVDVVAILAPRTADMATLRDSLAIQPVTESGLTVEEVNPYSTPDVIARGEADWGRWQVSVSSDDRCRSVNYVQWTPGELSPSPSGTSTCDPEQPFGSAICASAGPGVSLVIVLDAEADAVAVKVNGQATTHAVENGDGGAATLIDEVPPGPDLITVSIDGADTNCSPV